ncbi:MAG: SDR family oxidoreductase [Christensenellaceae bacterium]|jgi:NAD(P)-dependent dehydrogenase (short-subunit alcohol dehydrogenase family)|nr:SDR family oxidoreductase [Christensenellaceae bacterium]
MNTFSMEGKIVIVTGASRGIGRGLVSYFIKQGARVLAMARNEQRAALLREELKAAGENAQVYALDVCDVPSIQPVFDQIVKDHGRIDVLINNAGTGKPMPALEVRLEDWDELMNLNLRGAFFCAQAAARHMIATGKGRIVNMSSQISVVANENELVYCSSKGGLNQMTKVCALEWGKFGVTVNAVGPTFTYTPGTAERLDTPAFRDQVLRNIPRGRLGTIEDIGSAIQFLAADSSDIVNGHILMTDGGWTIV